MNNVQIMTGVLSATDMNLGERVAYAGRMLLVGMLAVFAVLTLIWGVLALSRIFLGGAGEKKKAEAPKAAPAPTAPDDGALAAAIAAVAAVTEEEATTAAITAAVAVYLASEAAENGTAYNGNFRVVSFRKVGGAWNAKR